jgi:hypothetical protein
MCPWKNWYRTITSIVIWSECLTSRLYANLYSKLMPLGRCAIEHVPRECNHCPLKAQCTTSKQGRTLCRSVEEEYSDRVRGYHETEDYKKAYRKRSVWVEPLCAEGKDWHGMRRFRLRLLWRVNCEALTRAAGQNLKRLLKQRGWGRRPFPAESVSVLFLASCAWVARLF